MKKQLWMITIVLCLFATDLSAQTNQKQNVFQALKAENIPSTIKAGELSADWQIVRVQSVSNFTDLLLAMESEKLNWQYLYYSKGDTFSFGGQDYLVTYTLDVSSLTDDQPQKYYLESFAENPAQRAIPKLERNTELIINLLNLSESRSLHLLRGVDPESDLVEGFPQVVTDRKKSLENLEKLGKATLQYAEKHNGILPRMVAAETAEELDLSLYTDKNSRVPVQLQLRAYINDPSVYIHPATGQPYIPNYKISLKPLREVNTKETPCASQHFLFFEAQPDEEDKRNVVYIDGTVATLDEDEFQEERESLGISESGYPSVAASATKK